MKVSKLSTRIIKRVFLFLREGQTLIQIQNLMKWMTVMEGKDNLIKFSETLEKGLKLGAIYSLEI
jgi:hypothetical protein